MKNNIYAIGMIALMVSSSPAIAQTMPSFAPYGQTAALPPTAATASPKNPNAPHWIQLEGYGGDGLVHEYWNLVTPHEFDFTNYHGFHTATD
jgi:hypothetical protein